MAVSLLASTFSVTCSAVVADPYPLGPGRPVISEKIPTIFLFLEESNQSNVERERETENQEEVIKGRERQREMKKNLKERGSYLWLRS